jgi:hypothetical protein
MAETVMSNAEVLDQLRGVVEELNERLENYIQMAPSSSEAADEGFLLATKADAIWRAKYGAGFRDTIWRRTNELERLVAGVEDEEGDDG